MSILCVTLVASAACQQEPAKTESAKAEATNTEAAKSDPPKPEMAKAQPAKAEASKADAAIAPDAAKFEMFVMSECPYGVQAVNAVVPVKKQLGSAMNLEINYIGAGTPGSFTSMHGPGEVTGDIVQLCAAKQSPDKYLDLILCQNRNPRAVDTNWKDCAKEVGIDGDELASCVNGDDGQKLLGESFAMSRARGANGSPTMFLNGQPYQGGRKTRDFLRAICNATPSDSKPETCANIPEPPTVHAIFFSDDRCKECNIRPLEGRIRSEFGGLTVQYVDYMSDEGKALYAKLKAASPDFKLLPTVLLNKDEAAKDTEGTAALQRYMHPIGEYQELMVGAKFDPTAEICDNSIDDDGDGLADCADDGCKEAMACREAKPKTLDLFVMSHCPYGAKAMIAANDLVDHFGDDITLNVHFIGNVQGDNLASMHGPSEVDDDIREACAIAHYGEKHQFMDFLACRSKNLRDADWKPCAKEAGLDEKVMQDCIDGEGKDLVKKSFALAQSLNIGASPTFLSNNKREVNAIDAATLQKQYCTDNPDVEGCKTQLKVSSAEPAGAPAQAAQCN